MRARESLAKIEEPFACHTTRNMSAEKQVDEACYEAGINWCWFTLRCGEDVARFRLHMEESSCWELLKALDSPNLHPTPKSGITFKYGSGESRAPPARDGGASSATPASFDWLEAFLASQHGAPEGATGSRKNSSWCEYEGVDFYKAA